MTGDYICPICGIVNICRCPRPNNASWSYWPAHSFGELMTTMPKKRWPERRVPRFDSESLPDPDPDIQIGSPALEMDRDGQLHTIGGSLTPDELFTVLQGFLGDDVFARRFAECIDMIKRKNADYTQGVAKRDRIAAFRRIGGDIQVPMRKVWAIFAQKHWGAVMKYVKDGQTESEPIGSRINDLINYFVLLGAIVDDEGRTESLEEFVGDPGENQ